MMIKKMLISLVLVVSALFKLFDFSATANYLQTLILFSVSFFKVALGLFIIIELIFAFLLVNTRSPITVDLLVLLLTGFCVLNIYMIIQNYDNCGCFGTLIRVNPVITIIKNVVLIAMLLDIKRKESGLYAH